VAHGYRIDTTRPALGPLQWSITGGLTGTAEDAWTDLAYGFTDIQTALQAFDQSYDGTDSTDPDNDPSRDWYSGDEQSTLTGTPLGNAPSRGVSDDALLQMSISLVARTDRPVEGITTDRTPQLTVPGNTDHNLIGDHDSVDLTTTNDPALLGARIYRFTTFQV